MARAKKSDRKIVEQKTPLKFDNTIRYKVPKLEFKKSGVNYKEGDRVKIRDGDGEYMGVLTNILSSQLVLRPDDCTDASCDKFFLQKGIQISKC